MLRRLKVVSIAAAAIIAGVLGYPSSGSAQPFSGTINLSGTIVGACNITVTQAGAASTLNLTATQTDLVVGTITQNCNDPQGYTLSISSLNCVSGTGARLEIDDTNYLAYTVTFRNDTTGTPTVSTVLLGPGNCVTQVGYNVSGPLPGTRTSEVRISYTGSGTLAAGTYTDTLTITMAQN